MIFGFQINHSVHLQHQTIEIQIVSLQAITRFNHKTKMLSMFNFKIQKQWKI